MDQNLSIHVPREWMEGISSEELNLQRIFRIGLQQYKMDKAILLYQEGMGSLGYFAERMRLDKQELIRYAKMHGVDPDFSEQTIREELA